MKKRLLVLIGVLFSFSALAGGKVHVEDNSVYLSDFQTRELEKMFEELAYDKYIDLPDEEYPRIFVKNIPSDFATQENETERNRTFMKILIPIVLKINEEISDEREMVDALLYDFEQHKDFSRMDMEYIDKLAQKYDVTTHFKDTRRYIKLLNELQKKVDIVPASLLVAGAAIYTNWGTSRIVLKANNLFKTKVWFEEDGLEPLEDKEDGYKYKIYPSLEACVRDYMLKLNSNINYALFRETRAVSRARADILYGKRMDWGMVLDSNLPNFGGLLDYTLTYYKLYHIDRAHLEGERLFEEQ